MTKETEVVDGKITVKMHPDSPFAWDLFVVGELVTRDGTDIHKVIEVHDDDDGQMITVECVKAPESGWCEVGETEGNLARRYSRLSDSNPPHST